MPTSLENSIEYFISMWFIHGQTCMYKCIHTEKHKFLAKDNIQHLIATYKYILKINILTGCTFNGRLYYFNKSHNDVYLVDYAYLV